ncbi:MAG: hypothetical protein JWN34_12, partial [Bryobacterales bacterium]|nr:hypothetical protein [Bryobacterales bacterium]
LDTQILIRPAARGGKYLGPDAARALHTTPQHISAVVFITDDATGQLAAWSFVYTDGKEAGPANLMDPVRRSNPYATDAGTVGVTLTVSIEKPTTFTVNVFGPLSHPGQGRRAEASITVLPGVNIGMANPLDALATTPEGLVIEVPGLCISDVKHELEGKTVHCSAIVTMMCGCKIGNPDTPNPGSTYPWPWPFTDFSVELVTVMTSGARYAYPLTFASNLPQPASKFCGSWPSQAKAHDGDIVHAWVSASQPSLGNQGFYQIVPSLTPALLPPHIEAVVGKVE